MGHIGANLRLTGPEEKALCRYINRLDRLNLAIRPEFIIDTVNTILQVYSSKSKALNLPLVGRH
jgi:hypothetical protein